MSIPLCCGMERSGSTMTWQIIKSIIPRSRPLGWEPGCEVDRWTGHPIDWPIKRHHYFSGERPIIYTYRNPIEAFLSCRRVFGSDAGQSIKSECEDQFDADSMALEKIVAHHHIYQSYCEDQAKGRPVLFLKYEDFYYSPEARVQAISQFLKVDPPLTDYEISILCDYTRIEKNIERAGRLKSFNDDRDPNTGMQANHVDLLSRGAPGSLLARHPGFVHAVDNEKYNLGPLKELCSLMEYEIPETFEKSQKLNKINTANHPTLSWPILK